MQTVWTQSLQARLLHSDENVVYHSSYWWLEEAQPARSVSVKTLKEQGQVSGLVKELGRWSNILRVTILKPQLVPVAVMQQQLANKASTEM